MSAETFLDTNIVVYTFDHNAPTKRDKALAILRSDGWFVSWQVIQEFANVALHRFAVPLSENDLAEYIDLVLMPHCRVLPGAALYRQALEIRKQTGYRFYDSLVVASALESGAATLYSEDLQHGREIAGLRIVNPFA